MKKRSRMLLIFTNDLEKNLKSSSKLCRKTSMIQTKLQKQILKFLSFSKLWCQMLIWMLNLVRKTMGIAKHKGRKDVFFLIESSPSWILTNNSLITNIFFYLLSVERHSISVILRIRYMDYLCNGLNLDNICPLKYLLHEIIVIFYEASDLSLWLLLSF